MAPRHGQRQRRASRQTVRRAGRSTAADHPVPVLRATRRRRQSAMPAGIERRRCRVGHVTVQRHTIVMEGHEGGGAIRLSFGKHEYNIGLMLGPFRQPSYQPTNRGLMIAVEHHRILNCYWVSATGARVRGEGK